MQIKIEFIRRCANISGMRRVGLALNAVAFSFALLLAATLTSAESNASGAAASTSSASSVAALKISVSGRNLVDAKGKILQLRGVNMSGLEYVAIQGWNPGDPWGIGIPSNVWDLLQQWKVNAVRIPLNEASWLGYDCVDGGNKVRNADPGKNYRATVQKAVGNATARNLYVILDLHITAPDDPLRAVNGVKAMCPMQQNPLPDAAHALEFWTSIATTFKGNSNVMFELYNEPFFYGKSGSKSSWETIRDGGTMSDYVTGDGSNFQIQNHPWKVAGSQQMLNAVRATGATNVILSGGPDWTQRLDYWLDYRPTDPLNQLAAAWHAYPAYGKAWGTPEYTFPGFKDGYAWAEKIVAAGVPVVITETGDHNAIGTQGAPFVSHLLPWADKNGISYFGWAFDIWPDNHDHVLLKDKTGAPTDGYGEYFKQHLACVAGAAATCP